jgi:sterol desaturase/sphingolipid hydroxylase (fatty acid hydroxylase superfamily)
VAQHGAVPGPLSVAHACFLILLPATALAGLWRPEGVQALVRAQPLWLQAKECVVVADLAQYVVHRLFHQVKWLWRFHVRLPWLDRLFGSEWMPVDGRWPEEYGAPGDKMPPGYVGQLVSPFR